MTAPTLGQSVSRISDADDTSSSSEVDISRTSRSWGGSSSRGEGDKYGAHTTRLSPTVTPIATPGRQTSSSAIPTSPKSVLRVFLGSAARRIFLCETIPTRSPASHFWRERFSLRPSPPNSSRAEGGPAIRPSPDSSDGGVENSPQAIYSAC